MLLWTAPPKANFKRSIKAEWVGGKKLKWFHKPKLQEVVNECVQARCMRRDGPYCLGWADPGYMWSRGRCPHVSHDPDLVKKLKAEGREYASR